MKASKADLDGSRGESRVALAFEEFGWSVAPAPTAETGVDRFIQLRDEDGSDLRLFAAVQVKSGDSYFNEPASQDGVDGWWHRVAKGDRFVDWTKATLPYVLVLHDLDANSSYWLVVRHRDVRTTGKGAKVFVPNTNTLSAAAKDRLAEQIADASNAGTYEGRRWHAGADRHSAVDLYRAALLTPRLVAPHPNRRSGRTLHPAEAVALIVDCDGHHLRDDDDRWPPMSEWREHSDLGWRLAGAAWELVYGEADLDDWFTETSWSEPTATAATVLESLVRCREGDYRASVEALQAALAIEPAPSAANQGWLFSRIAWSLLELSDIDSARAAAANGLAAVSTATGRDPTSTALAAACSDVLFITGDWDSRDLKSLAVSSDAAVSWWRLARLGRGYESELTTAFEDWASDGSVRWTRVDETVSALKAAKLNAELCGEARRYRGHATMFAQQLLVAARSDDNDRRVAIGLLRRHGAAKDLARAVARVREVGPLSALLPELVVDPRSIRTPRGVEQTVTLLSSAGDLVREDEAARAAEFLTATLLEPPSAWLERATFGSVRRSVLRAMYRLEPLLSRSMRADLSTAVLEGPVDEVALDAEASLLGELIVHGLDASSEQAVLNRAIEYESPSRTAQLLAKASKALPEARSELATRSENGDLEAFLSLPPNLVGEEVARAFSAEVSDRLDNAVSRAKSGHWSFGRRSPLWLACHLSLEYPHFEVWDSVLTALNEPRVPRRGKGQVFETILARIDETPARVVRFITDNHLNMDHPGERIPFVHNEEPLRISAGAIALRSGLLSATDAAEIITDMFRTDEGRAELSWALPLGDPEQRGVLLALASDNNARVRARAVARMCRTGRRPGSEEAVTLRWAAASDGVRLPATLAAGLASLTDSELVSVLSESLSDHPSIVVRAAVAEGRAA